MAHPPVRRALVTGASAGIGEAFARLLAGERIDLVLTARRQERLEALARELAGRFDIRADVVVADLGDPAAPARIHDESTAGGRPIDILINNAGYGLGGKFLDVSWEDHARFIQVLMTAVAELTYRFLPSMIDRQYGRIVNVASLAGLVPGTAGHTLYAASKAFVIKFSESVALEVQRHNVNVTALCPGFTYSEFHEVSGTRQMVSRLPRWMWMKAEPVVHEGWDAVTRGDIVYVPGRANRVLARLARLMPQSLVLAVTRRAGGRFRKVDAA